MINSSLDLRLAHLPPYNTYIRLTNTGGRLFNLGHWSPSQRQLHLNSIQRIGKINNLAKMADGLAKAEEDASQNSLKEDKPNTDEDFLFEAVRNGKFSLLFCTNSPR